MILRHPLLLPAAALAAALAVAAPAGAAPLPLSGTLDLAELTPAQGATWTSAEADGLAGAAVAGIGDFDGDGKPDVAVGEPKRDTAAGKDSGAVSIVLAPAGGGALADAAKTITIRGATAGSQAGFTVDAAGDVNGDGLQDVIVGAPFGGAAAETPLKERPGIAYVVLGRRDRAEIDLAAPSFGGFRMTASEPGGLLGGAVGAIGDLNGDGAGELLVGASKRPGAGRPDAGAAYVVFGRRAGGDVDLGTLVESGAGWRIDGPAGSTPGGALGGRGLASIGDLNGDTLPEVLVTAPRAGTGLAARGTPKGIAYVVWGRSTAGVVDLEALGPQGFAITGKATSTGSGDHERQGDFLGLSIQPVGDVNGDGRPDLAVGAHLADPTDRANGGEAYVVYGKADTTPIDVAALEERGFKVSGLDQDDQTGFDVSAAGDLNGDGVADIAIASPFAEPLSRPNAGAVYVVYGARSNSEDVDLGEIGTRALRIAGRPGQAAGFAVDAAGDVNGDGGDDLVIGATAIGPDYLLTSKADAPGTAHVVFGASRDPDDQAGADIVTDPGYLEEKRRGCTVATNVHVLMEDNDYTDDAADPKRIRLSGMQAYVATPRNQGTVLGVTGFDDDENADPIFEPTLLSPAVTDELNGNLAKEVDGRDSFPGYPYMARTFANDNPGAQARIMLVDGYLFEDMADYDGLTEGNPPTYVIAVGSPPDRSRDDIRQMRRLARDTEGRFYRARSPRGIERALQDIESRLRCDLEADDFHDEIDVGDGLEELAEAELERGVHTADVRLTWRDPRQGFEIARVDVVRGGNVVRRIQGEELARAYTVRHASAAVRGGRGRTFRALHLRGMRAGGTLRVVVRAQAGKRGGRVYARVTQSRRRR